MSVNHLIHDTEVLFKHLIELPMNTNSNTIAIILHNTKEQSQTDKGRKSKTNYYLYDSLPPFSAFSKEFPRYSWSASSSHTSHPSYHINPHLHPTFIQYYFIISLVRLCSDRSRCSALSQERIGNQPTIKQQHFFSE